VVILHVEKKTIVGNAQSGTEETATILKPTI
jgi:hypothetical protein